MCEAGWVGALFLSVAETEVPTVVFFLTSVSRSTGLESANLGSCLRRAGLELCASLCRQPLWWLHTELAVLPWASDFGGRCDRVDY